MSDGAIMGPKADPQSGSFAQGREAGLTWSHSHMPGGPFVHSPFPGRNDEAWLATCAQSRQDNADWLSGFREGLAARDAAAPRKAS